MDIFLIVLGIILLIAGLIGCFLPILPGPPLAYLALVALDFTDKVYFTWGQLIFWLVLVIIVQVADYFVPTLGVKKFGGSRYGSWGCLIGTLIGVFMFPPWGIIVGPFAGAFAGEMLSGKQARHALKAGFGAFIGFLFGTIFKLMLWGWFVFCFIQALVA